MKKIISSVLALAMVLCIFPFAGFSLTAFAASESDLTFELTYDGYSYEVSDCNENASGELVIPSEYNGKPVTRIGDEAFKDCKAITSVTIPGSVIIIGNRAFENCTGLNSVTIPESVTYIGDCAFSNCSQNFVIKGYTYSEAHDYAIKNSIKFISIGQSDPLRYELDSFGTGYRVKNCSTAYSGDIVIPSEHNGKPVTAIVIYAFKDCTGLTSVTIPNSVEEIENYAFCHCANLTSVTVFDSVVAQYAFDCCNPDLIIIAPTYSSAHDYTIENSINFVSTGEVNPFKYELNYYGESYRFSHCALAFKGEVVVLNEYNGKPVTEIGDFAFTNCRGVTSVTIPNSVTSIGWYAFTNCTGLTSVTIPDSVASIDSEAFEGCVGLTSIAIPDSVTYISSSAFSCCPYVLQFRRSLI